MGKRKGEFVSPEWSPSKVDSGLQIRQPTGKNAAKAKPTDEQSSEFSSRTSLIPLPIRSAAQLVVNRTDVPQWRPDVYAHNFIPRSLLAINSSFARSINLAPDIGIDFSKYISTFAGSHFLRVVDEPSYYMFSGRVSVNSLALLESENYGQYFGDCLTLDLQGQIPETRSYDLYAVTLEPLDNVKQLYSLRVPGLREGTPSISLGDSLMLRQLILDPLTRMPHGNDAWLACGYERGEMTPGFTGSQVRAVVGAIDKSNELLIINAIGVGFTMPLVCNVMFEVPPRIAHSLHRAVANVAHKLWGDKNRGNSPDAQHPNRTQASYSSVDPGNPHLETSTDALKIARPNRSDWLHNMLFPKEAYGIRQETLPSAVFPQKWFDKALNFEQQGRIPVRMSACQGSQVEEFH